MKNMSPYQRVSAQTANPVNFLLHLIGFIGAGYYLWNQNWQWAVLFGVLLPFIGHVYTWFAEKGKNVPMNLWREIWLSHAEPVNTALHLIGFVLAVIGFWRHDYYYLAGAVAAMCVGHLFGSALMTNVMPRMIKRLGVLDLMLIKVGAFAFGILVGGYASAFVMDFRWWILGVVVVASARPFAHFFMSE